MRDLCQSALPQASRILVVDDDRRTASAMAQWLCSIGGHATASGSETEATRAASTGGFDVCIIDAALPADGARRVAMAVRAASPCVGLVATVPGDPAVGAATADWADAAVALPFVDAALLAAVTAAALFAWALSGALVPSSAAAAFSSRIDLPSLLRTGIHLSLVDNLAFLASSGAEISDFAPARALSTRDVAQATSPARSSAARFLRVSSDCKALASARSFWAARFAWASSCARHSRSSRPRLSSVSRLSSWCFASTRRPWSCACSASAKRNAPAPEPKV